LQVERTTIFVYGTLKRGCRNHGVLRPAEFLGEAWTAPGYRMVCCGSHPYPYPGLVRAGEGERVAGEIYRVDAALLEALDRLEDVPREYERAPVRLSDGREAQAYLYKGETAHLPACGAVWVER
jgi:gamma-glutamylaminecyclotransferase